MVPLHRIGPRNRRDCKRETCLPRVRVALEVSLLNVVEQPPPEADARARVIKPFGKKYPFSCARVVARLFKPSAKRKSIVVFRAFKTLNRRMARVFVIGIFTLIIMLLPSLSSRFVLANFSRNPFVII